MEAQASSAAPSPAAREIDTACVPVVLLGKERGGSMGDEMGTFRVTVEIENPARSGERRTLESVLVDTGAELSWFPAALLESLGIERVNQRNFRQADGTVLARWTGGGILRVVGIQNLGEAGVLGAREPSLLGAHSLGGPHLRIYPGLQQPTDA